MFWKGFMNWKPFCEVFHSNPIKPYTLLESHPVKFGSVSFLKEGVQFTFSSKFIPRYKSVSPPQAPIHRIPGQLWGVGGGWGMEGPGGWRCLLLFTWGLRGVEGLMPAGPAANSLEAVGWGGFRLPSQHKLLFSSLSGFPVVIPLCVPLRKKQ